MKQIQFIGITPEELKKEIVGELLQHFQDLKKNSNHSTSLEYLTRKEVSKLLGVSLVTLNDWDRKGILKAYKIGNLVRYKSEEIEQALIKIHR